MATRGDSWTLYAGCASTDEGRYVEQATIALARRLKIDLWETPGKTCCGARSDRPEGSADAASVTPLLSEAEQEGLGTLCLSPVCRARLQAAAPSVTWSNIITTEGLLGQPGLGGRLADALTVDLAGLRVAVHSTCHSDHAVSGSGGIEGHADELIKLIARTGANADGRLSEVANCGDTTLIGDSTPPCLQLAGEAEAIVTPCFLCYAGLNRAQRRLVGDDAAPLIPVLHISQLLGVACSIPPGQLALDKGTVSPQRALALFV